jgi:hypothetical protein
MMEKEEIGRGKGFLDKRIMDSLVLMPNVRMLTPGLQM